MTKDMTTETPKWHEIDANIFCACTDGEHMDVATLDTMLALEARVERVEAKAALADEMAQELRVRMAVNLQRIPAALFEDWLVRYDALDQGAQEETTT